MGMDGAAMEESFNKWLLLFFGWETQIWFYNFTSLVLCNTNTNGEKKNKIPSTKKCENFSFRNGSLFFFIPDGISMSRLF